MQTQFKFSILNQKMKKWTRYTHILYEMTTPSSFQSQYICHHHHRLTPTHSTIRLYTRRRQNHHILIQRSMYICSMKMFPYKKRQILFICRRYLHVQIFAYQFYFILSSRIIIECVCCVCVLDDINGILIIFYMNENWWFSYIVSYYYYFEYTH